MKILVTGAGGMLGSAVIPALIQTGHTVAATDVVPLQRNHWPDLATPRLCLGELDVRSRDDIEQWFDSAQPDHVMHLAAETDVDLCQLNPDHAYKTNALGTRNVVLACQKVNVPLTYISTAGVFDGCNEEPYTEFDAPNPINVYGRSKLAGERCVESFLTRFFIVRAGWMVGGGDRDHKFVAKILQQLDAGATTLYAVDDKLGTPTYAPDFARGLAGLIATDSYGLYHMACQGRASRFDVAQKILEVLGRTDVELLRVNSEFFHATYPAPRPRSEMMRNFLLDAQGLNGMRPWEEAIEEYLLASFGDRVAKARHTLMAASA